MAQGGPYDVILLEGATEVEPDGSSCSQLTEWRPAGLRAGFGAWNAKAMLYRRSGGEMGGRPIFDAAAAPLPGFSKAPAFAF